MVVWDSMNPWHSVEWVASGIGWAGNWVTSGLGKAGEGFSNTVDMFSKIMSYIPYIIIAVVAIVVIYFFLTWFLNWQKTKREEKIQARQLKAEEARMKYEREMRMPVAPMAPLMPVTTAPAPAPGAIEKVTGIVTVPAGMAFRAGKGLVSGGASLASKIIPVV